MFTLDAGTFLIDAPTQSVANEILKLLAEDEHTLLLPRVAEGEMRIREIEMLNTRFENLRNIRRRPLVIPRESHAALKQRLSPRA